MRCNQKIIQHERKNSSGHHRIHRDGQESNWSKERWVNINPYNIARSLTSISYYLQHQHGLRNGKFAVSASFYLGKDSELVNGQYETRHCESRQYHRERYHST
jgi:hypothetical protein